MNNDVLAPPAAAHAIAALAAATVAHPDCALLLLLALPLLAPTHGLMLANSGQLYAAHLDEMIERLVAGGDLTLPTRAELLIACSEASLRAPFNRGGLALYGTLFREVFPDHPITAELAKEWYHTDTFEGIELRHTLTSTVQRRIERSAIRGKKQIAALRSAIKAAA